MDDALARGHQIDRARLDPWRDAERIAMVDRAVEQIGDGGEVDMRVRPDVHPLAGGSRAGPNWSTKMNGPTMVRSPRGSARRTLKAPRSWVTGVIVWMMESLVIDFPLSGPAVQVHPARHRQLLRACRFRWAVLPGREVPLEFAQGSQRQP